MPGSTILALLDQDWESLVASPAARSALVRWGRHDPLIAGLGDLNELLELRRSDRLAGAMILRTLAARAPHDVLAGRVLLQALIPGLGHYARTAATDDARAVDELISLAWERIRTYPDDRPGSVAANVLLDVRRRYREHRRIDAPKRRAPIIGVETRPPAPVDETVIQRLQVAEVVHAQRQGVIPDSAFELIVRTRIYDESLDDVAETSGVSAHCLMVRRCRSEQRLREHLWSVA